MYTRAVHNFQKWFCVAEPAASRDFFQASYSAWLCSAFQASNSARSSALIVAISLDGASADSLLGSTSSSLARFQSEE